MMVCRQGEAKGAYECLQVLGQGNFGVVYLGEDVTARRVALKSVTLKKGASSQQTSGWDAAVAEGALLHRLRHPHIVHCHECFEEQCANSNVRRLWLVLDLMDGGDMNTFCKSRRQALAAPPDAPFVRRLVSAVGDALAYVHKARVLHRDVKCANILLSHGHARFALADFGLACGVHEDGHLEELSAGCGAAAVAPSAPGAIGTPSYLSPEVLCGKLHSAHSDAWALGVCAFRAATLQKPFEGRDELTLMMKIVNSAPVDLPWSCAADVACAILGLLAKDCRKRLLPKDAIAMTRDAPIARLDSLARQMAALPPREFADLPTGWSRMPMAMSRL
mmetsp:Transcript_55738/g.156412  ORF Transcript_55738/g.156412 Transcript_55738/m.156412 type:complete len:334 (+) Transcript_55738:82-1083(+)